MSNHAGKQPVEEAIYESGMIFTVLQPTMFMQTLQSGWKEAQEHGTFSLPYSKHAKASYVDYRDVAEAAALALTGDKLDYGTFELCSRGMVDRIEMAALMGKALGRTIEPREPSFEEWLKTSKIPEGPMQEGFKKMYADYDQYGFPGGNALVLSAILGREPRTLEAFFTELASK